MRTEPEPPTADPSIGAVPVGVAGAAGLIAGWPRPLAFVLSGGGSFGSVQVGMLRALEERGIHPDLVVGTSAGALNGALLAAEGGAGAADRLAELWRRMDRRTVFGHGWWGAARTLARHRHLGRLEALAALIGAEMPPGTTFADLALPFAAVATDALTGEPALLHTGPLIPALLASAAVPGLFPPVEVAGRRYLDGGLAANLPIRPAVAFGARSVIGLDANPRMPADVPAGLLTGLLHSVNLIVRNQRAHAWEEDAGGGPTLVLPRVTPADLGSFDFSRTAELIDRAHHSAGEALDRFALEAQRGGSAK